MPLPSSGPIKFSDINSELFRLPNAPISMSNAKVRGLAQRTTAGQSVGLTNLQGRDYDPRGQAEYTTPGTYLWTCPEDVYFVHVVAVGGGGSGQKTKDGGSGGGGGGLGWRNSIIVNPGSTYTVVVGAGGPINSYNANGIDGSDSYFIDNTVVFGGKGGKGTGGTASGGTYVGEGGGNGGGSRYPAGVGEAGGGGGGAGGYTGNGGGGTGYPVNANNNGINGSGGGGGGGGGGFYNGGQGGGVGIYGQGANGTGTSYSGGSASAATAGSGGSGSTYGGGGYGSDEGSSGAGGGGAVRIIWGVYRAFPATNTADVTPGSYF